MKRGLFWKARPNPKPSERSLFFYREHFLYRHEKIA